MRKLFIVLITVLFLAACTMPTESGKKRDFEKRTELAK